jgi:hypothetical protein
MKDLWFNDNKELIYDLYDSFIRIFEKPIRDMYGTRIDWSSQSTFQDFCNFLYEVSGI